MEKKEKSKYQTSQSKSDSTKASFFQNNMQQQFIMHNSSNPSANMRMPKNNFLYSKKNPIRNINEMTYSSQPQNLINKTNSINNLNYPFNNKKNQDKLGEANQSRIINNQIEFNTKLIDPSYKIQNQNQINSVYNRGISNEYTIPNDQKLCMPLEQNQLLKLVFHYQNVIDNMNNNMNFMKDKFNEYQMLTQKQFHSTNQELFSTKHELFSTKQELFLTKKELFSTQQQLFSTKQDIKIMDNNYKRKFEDNEMKIHKINEDIKEMNTLYTKEILKIKSNFHILSEKLNFSTENENICLKSIKTILTILDKIIENSEKIKKYLEVEIEQKSHEIIILKKEVKLLKIRVRELQEYLIGRKLLKILLRKILQNCFISFSITSDQNKKVKICNAKLKKKNTLN